MLHPIVPASLSPHTMTRSIRLSAAVVSLSTLAALAACGRQATMTDELQRDLDQASTTSVELAPRPKSTTVVSAIELGEPAPAKTELPKTSPVPRAPQRAKAPAPKPAPAQHVAARAPTPAPVPVAETPSQVAEAPAPEPTPEPAPVMTSPAPQPVLTTPVPTPTRAPGRTQGRAPGRAGRGGGWWSTGDVIRNAPFPVNP